MTKRFGGLVAVDRLDLAVEEQRDPQHHRAQRRRQDHGVQLHHAILPARCRRGSGSTAPAVDGVTPDRVASAGINRTYQNIRLFRNLTAIENILVGMHIHLRSTWIGAVLQYPGDAAGRGGGA